MSLKWRNEERKEGRKERRKGVGEGGCVWTPFLDSLLQHIILRKLM